MTDGHCFALCRFLQKTGHVRQFLMTLYACSSGIVPFFSFLSRTSTEWHYMYGLPLQTHKLGILMEGTNETCRGWCRTKRATAAPCGHSLNLRAWWTFGRDSGNLKRCATLYAVHGNQAPWIWPHFDLTRQLFLAAFTIGSALNISSALYIQGTSLKWWKDDMGIAIQ